MHVNRIQHDTSHAVRFVQLRALLALMRPRQWMKNSFVLAPLIFSGLFLELWAIFDALFAVLLFCVASSAAYIVNDVHDIEKDRRHPRKRYTRPLAADVVSVAAACILLAFLYGILACAWFLVPDVVTIVGGYVALNFAYTCVLKDQPVLDIFTIATGFVLRVYAGATALAVPLSAWMFVTTLSLALYLAAMKRRQELMHNGVTGRAVLEKYSLGLIDQYVTTAATGTLVFYSLFVVSARPELVISIPFVLFGLYRYWYVMEQHGTNDSSTEAFSDWQLQLTALLWAAVCGWALWPE